MMPNTLGESSPGGPEREVPKVNCSLEQPRRASSSHIAFRVTPTTRTRRSAVLAPTSEPLSVQVQLSIMGAPRIASTVLIGVPDLPSPVEIRGSMIKVDDGSSGRGPRLPPSRPRTCRSPFRARSKPRLSNGTTTAGCEWCRHSVRPTPRQPDGPHPFTPIVGGSVDPRPRHSALGRRQDFFGREQNAIVPDPGMTSTRSTSRHQYPDTNVCQGAKY